MKTILTLLAMMAIAMVVSASNASAQDPPPCIIINGVKCYVQYDACQHIIAINCPGGATGTAQFRTLVPGDPCADADNTELDQSQPINAALQPVSIDVNLPDPNYGNIRTTLDPTRTAGNTTIVSVNREAGEVFPLSVRIRFYAQAELESEPGVTYLSQTPLIFGSDNVNSLSPFQNETFVLQNDVNYYRQGDDSQAPVFGLQAGTTNLTIGGDGRNGDGGIH